MKRLFNSQLSFFILLLIVSPYSQAGGGGGTAVSKYFSLSPPMVVNVSDNGKVRHLQINIQLRLNDPADTASVQEHKPAIQHELVMLLSGREAKDVRTTKGKESLRSEATKRLKKILTENLGKPTIKDVYFTTFVIQ